MQAASTRVPSLGAAIDAHRLAHWAFRSHERRCARAQAALPCSRCTELADAADGAGLRWRIKEWRAVGGGRP